MLLLRPPLDSLFYTSRSASARISWSVRNVTFKLCSLSSADLNPASYKYLEVNARTNNCSAQRLRPYCMDGR
jgi:hypothetical protein